MEWTYLTTPPFLCRQVLAAHYVKGAENIIEIGSYRQPISRYLHEPFKKCLCIDPLVEPLSEGKVEQVRQDYRTFDFSPYQERYALVLLGMDLPVHEKLFSLVNGAERVIVEFPPDHLRSRILFELLSDLTLQRVALSLKLDLSENEFGDLSASHPLHPKRAFYLLLPRK